MPGPVNDNTAESRFEMEFEGKIVFADYRKQGSKISIMHVEAPEELRGTGAAGKFMQALAEKARAEDLKLIPVCGYAASWLERHKAYKDVIA